jgi:hypothetical protein
MTLVWRPGFQFDTDASTYIEAVEAADTQALETATRYAINDFVIGCKQDGIWSAIKASCILAGARTRQGALVPLANASSIVPTFNGTAGGWNYNRKTGLQGNGTDNYLDSSRDYKADPQNNRHVAVYCTQNDSRPSLFTDALGGQPSGGAGRTILEFYNGNVYIATNTTNTTVDRGAFVPGMIGGARSDPTFSTSIHNKSLLTSAFASAWPALTSNLLVFAINNPTPANYTNARLAFYSIGESLNLAALDARVTALITAFGVAIP